MCLETLCMINALHQGCSNNNDIANALTLCCGTTSSIISLDFIISTSIHGIECWRMGVARTGLRYLHSSSLYNVSVCTATYSFLCLGNGHDFSTYFPPGFSLEGHWKVVGNGWFFSHFRLCSVRSNCFRVVGGAVCWHYTCMQLLGMLHVCAILRNTPFTRPCACAVGISI